MRTSWAYQEILQEGIEEGLEKGRQEGRQEGKIELAHELIRRKLQRRFGDVPNSLYDRLRRITDLPKLETLIDLAESCGSFDEFTLAI